MKVTQRIPLDQYAYIEFEEEYDSPEHAIAHNAELVSYKADQGIAQNQWAELRRKMFNTGEFDPNIEGLSKAQRYFINQCKLAIRDTQG